MPLFRLRMERCSFERAAQEFVADKVDVIVTQAVSATRAARQATTTIPIVMVHAGNPELLPRLQKLALHTNPTNPGMPPAQKDIASAVEQLGIELLLVPATRHEDVAVAFETIRGARPDALLVLIEPMLSTHRRELIDFAASTRIPMLTDNGATAREGGLMSYGSILPVQQPTKFELIINLRTARQTSVAIPQPLLVRADEVIQ